MKKTTWIKLGIVVCALYILSPLDLVPEIFLGPVGLIDDVSVLGVLTLLVRRLIRMRRELPFEKPAVPANPTALPDRE